MPVFNNNRSKIIQVVFVVVFGIMLLQLINLQLISREYRKLAMNNAVVRNVIYPNRGIIYDRKGKSLLENETMFDLLVTPIELKGLDTLAFCNILEIDTASFKKRITRVINKTGNRSKQGVFQPLLSQELYSKLSENMYRFPGFVLMERSVRSYPFNAAGNVLGYVAEVDTNFLKKHKEEGYEMGDYAGMTGLERSYEKVLMGTRGVKYLIRDKNSRNLGSYENGAYDTTALAGKNLYSSIDVELQKLGEKLMTNKVGSIVAINPQTGGILCMVSAPTYNPNYLTGPDRRKHFNELFTDPRKALQNRPISNTYSPGSTFKTFVGIVGMNEGLITDKFSVSCGGAYYGCRRMGCHAVGTFSLKNAIALSCNSYFATVFRKILDSDKYPTRDSALNKFNEYAYSFGMGVKLGIDLPSEKRGNIPTSGFYRKMHTDKWQSCNIVSNSIGQGEVTTTLTQLANMMAIIANKGYYYTPHLIDSIEGGDEYGLLEPFKKKINTLNVNDSVFNDVQAGMQATVESGTASAYKIDGITMCGKTGTVENTLKGVKMKDHAFFGAFAPRENPKIAIAVMCENAGYGATSAAPIASLLVEKYLKDSIVSKDRKDLEERITKTKLIPSYMQREIDSVERVRQAYADSLRELAMDKENTESQEGYDIKPLPLQIPATPTKPKDSIPKRPLADTSVAFIGEDKKFKASSLKASLK